jgi:hypothetical protein
VTLSEIIQDIHACDEDMLMYERKYGILTPTFYESFMQGDEPPNDAWVLDWNGWAATYEIWLERRQHYDALMVALQKKNSIVSLIAKAARREPIALPA